jgi:hypothetical protein
MLAVDAIKARNIEVDSRSSSSIGLAHPPLYLAGIGVSFVSEGASIGLCLLVALFFAIRGWPMRT